MKNSDSESLAKTAPKAEKVRRHLRRLLEIIATQLAKGWVQDQPSLIARKNAES